MNRVICVFVVLLCGRVQAQALPIPTSELRPYAELEELLIGERLKEIEAMRGELAQLEQAITHEKRRLSTAEKRELTKSKARIKAIDADIEKLKRAKLSEIPKMTLEQALKNAAKTGRNSVAYVMEGDKTAVMTITENRSDSVSSPDHARAILGGVKVMLYKESGGSLFKEGQQYKLDRPCTIFQESVVEFYDDSPLLEAKKAKDIR